MILQQRQIWPTFHQFFCHKGESNPQNKKYHRERLPLSYKVIFFITDIDQKIKAEQFWPNWTTLRAFTATRQLIDAKRRAEIENDGLRA